MDKSPSKTETVPAAPPKVVHKPNPGPLWGVITPTTPIIVPLKSFAAKPKTTILQELPIITSTADVDEEREHINQSHQSQRNSLVWSYSRRRIRGAKSKKIKSTKQRNLWRYFEEYSAETDMHGVRYLAEPRSICEKIFWIVVLAVLFCLCILMIVYTLHHFNANPIIMGFENKETPVHSVAFPAVTICNECKSVMNQFNYSAALEKLKRNENLTDKEHANLQVLYMVCDHYINNDFGENITFTEEFYSTILQLSPPPDDWMTNCYFMGSSRNCSDIFMPVIVDEGVCYSFNMLDKKQIFKERVKTYEHFFSAVHANNLGNTWLGHEYHKSAEKATYPHRALVGGENYLEISLLHWRSQHDHWCKFALRGFRVLLHNPQSIPHLSKYNFRVPLDSIVTAAVFPDIVSTKPKVEQYEPNKRLCYTIDEKPLKYYKTYSHLNCMRECFANYSKKHCGCVPFHLPGDKDDKICGSAKFNCQKSAEVLWKSRVMYNLEDQKYSVLCDCLPLCSVLTYNWKYSVSQWQWYHNPDYTLQEYKDADKILKDGNVSIVRIFFKNEHVYKLERDVLYTTAELVANFGGLMNLFLGLSILTGVQIIYYLTLRIICNVRLFKSWAGPQN